MLPHLSLLRDSRAVVQAAHLSYSYPILNLCMRTQTSYKTYKQRKRISRITGLIVCIVGFILSLPFVLDMIFTATTAVMPLSTIIYILLFIPGLPMFMFGAIGALFAGNQGTASASTVEGDLGRIRHAVETDRFTRR